MHGACLFLAAEKAIVGGPSIEKLEHEEREGSMKMHEDVQLPSMASLITDLSTGETPNQRWG